MATYETRVTPFRAPAGRALLGVRVARLVSFLFLAVAGVAAQESPGTQPTGTSPASAPVVDEGGIEDIDLLDLEIPMVVTASRREQKIIAVPHAIAVITAKDIRLSGARSIPDALRLVPGMDVAELSYGNYAVSPRGFHGLYADKVLVLVDGRQMSNSLFDGTLWGVWPFQLEDVERIEVIRGPGGVTWGANAVNGVINIISKDPRDQLGLTFTGGGGSRGANKEHLGYAFQDDKLRMRVSGEFESADGFSGRGGPFGNLDDDYKSGRIGLHTIYESGPDDTLTLSLGSSVVSGGFPLPLFSRFDTREPKAQANFILGKWSHRDGPGNTSELTAYINDFYHTPGPRWADYRYQQVAVQFGHTFVPSDEHTVTWGIDTRWDLISAANADPFMLSQAVVRSGIVGVYVQDEWRFTPRWTFNFGGRVDYDFYGGFEPSGRAALSYSISETSLLYGAISRAFHMPSGGRRFVNFPLLGPLLRVTADRGMDPESLNAYELGYRGRLFKRLSVDANAYWHHYRDVIENIPRLGPPGIMQLRGENATSLSLYGVELDLRYAATESLTLLGNYTFQQADSGSTLGNSGSISPPKNKFMIGARDSPADNVHFSSHLYFVDSTDAPNGAFPMAPQSIDSYLRLDLRAEYELPHDKGSFAIGIRNLLDRGHAEGGASSMANAEVPRMIFAALRLLIK